MKHKILISLTVAALAGFPLPAKAAILLATAGDFAVLAGSAVTNTGPFIIDGDVRASPSLAITGLPPLIGKNLDGRTLLPGVDSYSASAQLTEALTLGNLGDPNEGFLFQIGEHSNPIITNRVRRVDLLPVMPEIPEPSTLALLASGLVCLASLAVRRP